MELSNIDFFNCLTNNVNNIHNQFFIFNSIDYLKKVINLWTYTIYLVMVCCWYLSNHHMLLCNLFIFTILSQHQNQLLDKMIFIYELIGVNPTPLRSLFSVEYSLNIFRLF
jgi:hypothetical protein